MTDVVQAPCQRCGRAVAEPERVPCLCSHCEVVEAARPVDRTPPQLHGNWEYIGLLPGDGIPLLSNGADRPLQVDGYSGSFTATVEGHWRSSDPVVQTLPRPTTPVAPGPGYRGSPDVDEPRGRTPLWRRLLWPLDLLRARLGLWLCRRGLHRGDLGVCDRCGSVDPAAVSVVQSEWADYVRDAIRASVIPPPPPGDRCDE